MTVAAPPAPRSAALPWTARRATERLLLVAAGICWRLFTRDWQEEPDSYGLLQFAGILVLLTGVVMLSAGSAVLGRL